MRITICAIGRVRGNPAAGICEAYQKRLPWDVTIQELEVKKHQKGEKRLWAEAKLLQESIPKRATIIALDAQGKILSSKAFARRICFFRDEGNLDIAFLIGGAEGLHQNILETAELVLSLGAMTWPHLMARAMLMEQLYRTHTILTGHPYHRD